MRNKDNHGFSYGGKIEIDTQGEAIRVIVHELIHEVKPDWSEKKVEAMERQLMATLSHRQLKNILTAFVRRLEK